MRERREGETREGESADGSGRACGNLMIAPSLGSEEKTPEPVRDTCWETGDYGGVRAWQKQWARRGRRKGFVVGGGRKRESGATFPFLEGRREHLGARGADTFLGRGMRALPGQDSQTGGRKGGQWTKPLSSFSSHSLSPQGLAPTCPLTTLLWHSPQASLALPEPHQEPIHEKNASGLPHQPPPHSTPSSERGLVKVPHPLLPTSPLRYSCPSPPLPFSLTTAAVSRPLKMARKTTHSSTSHTPSNAPSALSPLATSSPSVATVC